MVNVLVVGATGKLGGKIVRALRERGAAVRFTYRDRSTPEATSEARPEVAALVAAGAVGVPADLADEAALTRACEGVDVVVAAVQGLRDVIVDGQARLIRAAEAAGVARLIPSDYSVDFFKTAPGGNRNLDLRRELNGLLDASKVRGTSVLCGAFMDLIAYGAIGPDPKTGVFKVWGDPDQRYDFCSTDDLARYVAAVALDADAGRVIRVAGDSLSPRQLAAVFEEVRGTKVTLELGTLAALDRAIDAMKTADPALDDVFPVWQRMQYGRDMASGAGALEPLDNARYPDIRPMTVRELLRAAGGRS